MRRYMPFLAAALCAGLLILLSPAKADAGQYAAFAQAISGSQPQAATLLKVGYYGGGDYYGDDQKSKDYDDSPKQNYYGGGYDKGGYGDGGYQKHGYGSGGGYHKGGYGGSGYYGGGGYDDRRKYDDGYPDGCCKGCYRKKWVCEESEPRCRKARECVWYYGKEYCRYVRRCHGGGDRYCKWVSYPNHNCDW